MKRPVARIALSVAVFLIAVSAQLGTNGSPDVGVRPAKAAGQTRASTASQSASLGRPIIIGLDADMSGSTAQGGEAIRRGIIIAMDEINAAGGVLGRPLRLEVRDHRANPARGIDNIEEFARMTDLVAVVGGVHTPVALAELATIHRHGIVYLGPWAAGTPVVDNGHTPNFVFRVSVRDQFAGAFLIKQAASRGYRRPGLLLERTGWGRSNEAAMQAALHEAGLPRAPVQWFNWSVRDLSAAIEALASAGVDVVMLVANPVEGAVAVRSMAQRPAKERLPIISHWGITGGDFHAQVAEEIALVDLMVLQTYSFFEPAFPARDRQVFDAYCTRFGGCSSPADVIAPVGTAHAYDLVHLLSRAIERAGTADRAAVRNALETPGRYRGLVRDYDPAFTPERHDALTAEDFRLARFNGNGAIVPVEGQ